MVATAPIRSNQDQADPHELPKMMAAVLGSEGFMLTTLLFMSGGEEQVSTDQIKYFTGPVIFGKTDQQWELPPETTENLIKATRLERFWLILDEVAGLEKTGQTCTAAELVCAIQPYTHVAPLSHNLSSICTNSFGRVLEMHPDLFPAGKNKGFVEQFKVPIADTYELSGLQLKIRRRVTKQGINPTTQSGKPKRNQGETDPNAPVISQISLF